LEYLLSFINKPDSPAVLSFFIVSFPASESYIFLKPAAMASSNQRERWKLVKREGR